MRDIESNLSSIKNLCLKHHVEALYTFDITGMVYGSSCTLGFMVRFDPRAEPTYVDNYYAFRSELRSLLSCEIELLEEYSINNPFVRKIIDASKKRVYGQQNKG